MIESDVVGARPDLIQLAGHLRSDIVTARVAELGHVTLQIRRDVIYRAGQAGLRHLRVHHGDIM